MDKEIKVSVIGSGNVATHLVKELVKAGVTISDIWSPNEHHKNILASLVNATAEDSLQKLSKNSDFYIIAVSDDKISEVVGKMPDVKGVVCHTSGITPMSVFHDRFRNYGVFYPLQTFSKNRKVNFREIPFCLEAANEKNLDRLKVLAGLISEKIYEVSSEQRKYLHLAAVFTSNFVNYMYLAGSEILKEKELSFELLNPLVREVATKVEVLTPYAAQTGPAKRKDIKSIEKHQELLKGIDKDYLELYNLLTAQIIKKYHEL